MNSLRWNQPTAKARGPHPVDGRMTIIDMPPIEIIKNPNRRAIEEIINALCMITVELVEIKEMEQSRFEQVQKMIAEAKNGNTANAVPNGQLTTESKTSVAPRAKRRAKRKPADSARV